VQGIFSVASGNNYRMTESVREFSPDLHVIEQKNLILAQMQMNEQYIK